MTFTVTYRGKNGALADEVVEAPSRAECVAALKARGIAPTAIREGRVRTSGKATGTGTSHRGAKLAAVLAAAALAVAGGAWWWMQSHQTRPEPVKRAEPPRPAPRKPVAAKPAKPRAPKPAAKVAAPEPPRETNIIDRTQAELARVRARMKNASPESLENLRLKEADLEKLLKDPKYQFYMTNTPHVAYQPFKTCTEQVMDWIFNCNVGDDPPPFVPPLDPGEMANIDAILDRANELVEEDTAETADRKQMVELAKKELKNYLAQGGNAADFLHYYHQQLTTAYELRLDASRLVKEYSRDATPEETRKFLEATNKELAKKGIGPVMLSDKMKQKIGLPVEEKEVQK